MAEKIKRLKDLVYSEKAFNIFGVETIFQSSVFVIFESIETVEITYCKPTGSL
jgi:hypothetical protein